MSHVVAQRLAGQALGEVDALTSEELDHLAACPSCLRELDELREVVGLSTDQLPDYRPMVPSPRVWQGIDAALRGETGERLVDRPSGSYPPPRPDPAPVGRYRTTSAQPGSSPRRRRPRRTGVVVLAAAVGAVVGLGGVLGYQSLRSPEATLLASTPLQALPGHTGSGRADLVQTGAGRSLRVQLDAPPAGPAYRELWLINTDGQRMYSLGVLPNSGADTYPIPPELATGLRGYTIVDVSIEPYDGDSAHSRNSLVRGSLPN